jgi:hypothetical protein
MIINLTNLDNTKTVALRPDALATFFVSLGAGAQVQIFLAGCQTCDFILEKTCTNSEVVFAQGVVSYAKFVLTSGASAQIVINQRES